MDIPPSPSIVRKKSSCKIQKPIMFIVVDASTTCLKNSSGLAILVLSAKAYKLLFDR